MLDWLASQLDTFDLLVLLACGFAAAYFFLKPKASNGRFVSSVLYKILFFLDILPMLFLFSLQLDRKKKILLIE